MWRGDAAEPRRHAASKAASAFRRRPARIPIDGVNGCDYINGAGFHYHVVWYYDRHHIGLKAPR